ncbi:PIN domain-containing protein [Candidatus Pacearchaeota archaeon]|nr:PIN domain-containing protein [Candidatus Pacearchaeota archaeon]
MYCLDTNILIDILRDNEKTVEKIKKLREIGLPIATTPLNICELYKGAYISKQSEENINMVEEIMESVKIISFKAGTYDFYGNSYKELTYEGKMTNEIDLIVASISASHNYILITKNKKHFENIPRLKLEVW